MGILPFVNFFAICTGCYFGNDVLCACSIFVQLDGLDLLALLKYSQHFGFEIGIGLRGRGQARTTL